MFSLKELNDIAERFNGIIREIPLHGFSPEIQSIIRQFAIEKAAPANYIATGMLITTGSLIGRRVKVIDQGWWNYMNLYGCLVGPPGSAKSPSVDYLVGPVISEYKKQHKDYLRLFRQYKENPQLGEKPIKKCLIATNATTEKILNILANQQPDYGGLLMNCGELYNTFGGGNLDKYSRGNSIGIFNDLYSGRSFPIDRMSDEEGKFLDEPFLSIIGETQPKYLRDIFSRYEGSGFLARWLFVYSNGKPERGPANSIYMRQWEDIVQLILDTQFEDLFFGDIALKRLHQADAERQSFCDYLAPTNSELAEHIIKQNYTVRRLSGIVHMLNAISQRVKPTNTITLEEYVFAEELTDFFIETAAITLKIMKSKQVDKLGIKALIQQLNEKKPITNISQFAQSIGMNRVVVSRYLTRQDSTDEEHRQMDANDMYARIVNYITNHCGNLLSCAGLPGDEFADSIYPYGEKVINDTLNQLNQLAKDGQIVNPQTVYTILFASLAGPLKK